MNPNQERFIYHLKYDPQLRFFLWYGETWNEIPAAEIDPDMAVQAPRGIVTYASGEILCAFGDLILDELPEGVHYMEGPVYRDDSPDYQAADERRGRGCVEIWHGPSRSRSGDPRTHYSTSIRNLGDGPIRVTKFGFVTRGSFGTKKQTEMDYYSPTQFREWFRVPDSEGWIAPNETVCDPDNWGESDELWAYFFEDASGNRFITTIPVRNESPGKR